MTSNAVMTQNKDTGGPARTGRAGSQEAAGERNTAVLPPVDIFEDDAGFTVMADLPGVSKERLNVRVDGDSLVIEGAAESPVAGEMAMPYRSVTSASVSMPGDSWPRSARAVITSGHTVPSGAS